MPQLTRGDIFTAATERNVDLAIVFGHIGLNEMGPRWRAFSSLIPAFANVGDPFSKMANSPQAISASQWIWFVPEQQNHGMTELELRSMLDSALLWAKEVGVRSIITNGIMNTDHGLDSVANRDSDDQRVQFLITYAAKQEQVLGLNIELISLNDAFVRNVAWCG